MTVHGVPLYVITNGQVVLDEGQLKMTQGLGRFVIQNMFMVKYELGNKCASHKE
ncbi:hypothetical protein SNE40_003856 [Patella caerulea]|uniref:Uncharacterized protein n=1 Tax=Patella caerulea TaxID=87958 RepID=A0AAN8Q5W7_PATCE